MYDNYTNNRKLITGMTIIKINTDTLSKHINIEQGLVKWNGAEELILGGEARDNTTTTMADVY